ncbi:MAG: PilW family protein [Candidatus Methylomirabilia bacterium]
MTKGLSFPCGLRGPVAADLHRVYAPRAGTHFVPPTEASPPRHPSSQFVTRNRSFHHRSTGGFTLIELVLTLLILGIIAATVSQFALQGLRSYSTEEDRGDAHSQARLALERVVREARTIRSCADIVGAANPAATLSFTDIAGTPVAFSVAGGNLLRGASVLARGVTSAQPFRFLDMDGVESTSCPLPTDPAAPTDVWFVEIDLTCAVGSGSLRLRSRVHPRNFP